MHLLRGDEGVVIYWNARIGAILSVAIGDSRAGREWRDAIAAKSIEVIETGSGVGIEDGVSLSLAESGQVQIEAGVTSVGIGVPGLGSHVDVVVLDDLTDEIATRLRSIQPAIIVVAELIEPLGGVTVVTVQQSSVELLFDDARWEVRAFP